MIWCQASRILRQHSCASVVYLIPLAKNYCPALITDKVKDGLTGIAIMVFMQRRKPVITELRRNKMTIVEMLCPVCPHCSYWHVAFCWHSLKHPLSLQEDFQNLSIVTDDRVGSSRLSRDFYACHIDCVKIDLSSNLMTCFKDKTTLAWTKQLLRIHEKKNIQLLLEGCTIPSKMSALNQP